MSYRHRGPARVFASESAAIKAVKGLNDNPVKTGDVLGMIGGLVFWFVYAFLMAGILATIFAFVLGDEGRYVQYLAVMSHAWIIPAAIGLLLVPLRISEQNPQLTLNLGTFFYFLPEGYLEKMNPDAGMFLSE